MKNYEITEEQIKELAKGNAKVKNWFPDVFETTLKVGWYKFENKPSDWWLGFIDEEFNFYGFNEKRWFKSKYKLICRDANSYTKATDSEVLEALTNEAKKKGLLDAYIILIKGDVGSVSSEKTKTKVYMENGNLCVGSNFRTYTLFSNGVWATPIKTYTKEEAEKMLNAKII